MNSATDLITAGSTVKVKEIILLNQHYTTIITEGFPPSHKNFEDSEILNPAVLNVLG